MLLTRKQNIPMCVCVCLDVCKKNHPKWNIKTFIKITKEFIENNFGMRGQDLYNAGWRPQEIIFAVCVENSLWSHEGCGIA